MHDNDKLASGGSKAAGNVEQPRQPLINLRLTIETNPKLFFSVHVLAADGMESRTYNIKSWDDAALIATETVARFIDADAPNPTPGHVVRGGKKR